MDVVDKIANTKTKNLQRYGNVPIETVSIIKARVIKQAPVKPAEKQTINTELKSKPKT
jgi:hypothetical protein